MWPNAVKTFNRPSDIQIVCLGYFWFHRNVIKNICKNIKYKNSEKNKNMIRGIHFFSAELKRKLMSSQGAALIIATWHIRAITADSHILYSLPYLPCIYH